MDIMQLLHEQGIIGGLFILFILLILYGIKRIIDGFPLLIGRHFEELMEARKEFTKELSDTRKEFSLNIGKITEEHTKVMNGFLEQLDKLADEHYKQMEKMDKIHDDIKVIKKNFIR